MEIVLSTLFYLECMVAGIILRQIVEMIIVIRAREKRRKEWKRLTGEDDESTK